LALIKAEPVNDFLAIAHMLNNVVACEVLAIAMIAEMEGLFPQKDFSRSFRLEGLGWKRAG